MKEHDVECLKLSREACLEIMEVITQDDLHNVQQYLEREVVKNTISNGTQLSSSSIMLNMALYGLLTVMKEAEDS